MRWRLIGAFMFITLLVVLVQDIPLGNYLVRVERDAADTGSWQGDQISEQAEHGQHDAGYEEQLPRTVQKKET